MINTVEKLNDRIASCTQCLEGKITGSDGKRHIVLCGGTGCLSNNSAEIRAKFVEVLEIGGNYYLHGVRMIGDSYGEDAYLPVEVVRK